MSAPDDDWLYHENRREDDAYAREKRERETQIARGFSHNADALRALYGSAKRQPHSGSDDVRKQALGAIRSATLDSRQRLLNQIAGWRDPVAAMYGDRFRAHLVRIDFESAGAGAELNALRQQVEETAQLWRGPRMASRGVVPPWMQAEEPGDLNARLDDFRRELGHLIEWHEEYRWAVQHY